MVRETMHGCKPKFVGILGPGGIGKTKLAKEFLLKKEPEHSGSCFISNVKENSPTSLLRKLLKDLIQSEEQIDIVEQELTIMDCGIMSLLQDLEKMNNLKVLRVCNCPLEELSFRVAVNMISQRNARLLGAASRSEAPCGQCVCPKLQHLWIYSCRDLVKVGSMPKTLKTVDLSYCNTLREIEGLPDLARLEQLDMSGCEEVEELPSLAKSSGVEIFEELEGF